MKKKTISPYAGYPPTRTTKSRDGTPKMIVTAHDPTPFRAKVVDFLAKAGALYQLWVGLSHLGSLDASDKVVLAVVFGGPLVMYPVYKAVLRWFLSVETRVEFTPTAFRVKTGWFRWDRYDRQIPHTFERKDHRKAKSELEQYEIEKARATRNGQAFRKTRYYGESFHIVFRYRNTPIELMTIYGPERAEQVLGRLHDCDEKMDEILKNGSGDGTDFSPKQQWSDGTGGIE